MVEGQVDDAVRLRRPVLELSSSSIDRDNLGSRGRQGAALSFDAEAEHLMARRNQVLDDGRTMNPVAP